MTKKLFDNFIIETAENGYLIRAFMADPEIPPTLYVATDAVQMISILSGFVGSDKATRQSASIIKMEPKP